MRCYYACDSGLKKLVVYLGNLGLWFLMPFTFDSKYEENCVAEDNLSIEFFPDLAQFLEDEAGDEANTGNGIKSEWAMIKIGTLQSRLDSLQSQRFSSRFPYKISTFTIISLANEVFGYDGWSSQIMDFEMTADKENMSAENIVTGAAAGEIASTDRYTASGTARIRVFLADGTCTEATGISTANNLPKGICYGNCRKQAITDASKNAILGFRDMLLDYEVKVKTEQTLPA